MTLVSTSLACNAWHAEQGPMPDAAIKASSKGKDLRVRLTSGGDVFLREARVTRDSIVGWSGYEKSLGGPFCVFFCAKEVEWSPTALRAIALADVRSVHVYEFDAVVGLLRVGALALIVWIFASLSNH